MERTVMMLLRVGVAMCFIGHGVFGALQKREWLVLFDRFGIGESAALPLMPLVGTVDIIVGLLALVWPRRAVFAYGAVWALFTAALRPMAGLSVAEFLERAGNYGVPLAVLVSTVGMGWLRRVPREMPVARWREVFAVSAWTTATLLVGHGWLALQSKPLLIGHLALVGVNGSMVPLVGAAEVSLAIACIVRPNVTVFAAAAIWKIVSEALFISAGAPVWEFIERGGSYVAPIVCSVLARAQATRVSRPQTIALWRSAVGRPVALMLAVALLQAGIAAQSPASVTPSPELLQALRGGGLIVACRHAITSHAREDRMPVDFDDPSTQRVLSPAGEAQAKALGERLAGLKIRFGQVLASPFQRTRTSAELMAGRVTIDDALSSMSRGKDGELKTLMWGPVPQNENRLLVTHQGLLYRSFRSVKPGSIAEGDCVVVRPGEAGGEVLAILKPDDWKQP